MTYWLALVDDKIFYDDKSILIFVFNIFGPLEISYSGVFALFQCVKLVPEQKKNKNNYCMHKEGNKLPTGIYNMDKYSIWTAAK